jgi:hypothetical protein
MPRCTLLLVLLLTPAINAEKSRLGLSPEDQKKVDDLRESAREKHSLGVLLTQVAAVFIGIAFLAGAYSTVKKGFKITSNNVITGTGANVIAGVLVVLGIAIAVGGILYAQSFAPQ